MNKITLEKTHPELMGTGVGLAWLEFSGPTWDELHALLDELVASVRPLPSPVYLIYVVETDLPRGNPLPHIRRMITVVEKEPNILHMITVLPKRMVLASKFAGIAARVLRFDIDESTVVSTREEALAACVELAQGRQA